MALDMSRLVEYLVHLHEVPREHQNAAGSRGQLPPIIMAIIIPWRVFRHADPEPCPGDSDNHPVWGFLR